MTYTRSDCLKSALSKRNELTPGVTSESDITTSRPACIASVMALTYATSQTHKRTSVCLSFHTMAKEHVHALKGLVCRKRVAADSSPARHACGCARPSRARFGHRSSKILSNGSKTKAHGGTRDLGKANEHDGSNTEHALQGTHTQTQLTQEIVTNLHIVCRAPRHHVQAC